MTARGATMTGKRSPLPPIQGTKQSENITTHAIAKKTLSLQQKQETADKETFAVIYSE